MDFQQFIQPILCHALFWALHMWYKAKHTSHFSFFSPSSTPYQYKCGTWLCSSCMGMLSHVQLFATHGLQPTRPLCLWNFPGKNTGVGCHAFLQGIFPTHRSKTLVSPALTGRFFTNCATCGTWLYSSITSKNVASYRRYLCLQQTLLEVQGYNLNRKEVEEWTKLPPN